MTCRALTTEVETYKSSFSPSSFSNCVCSGVATSIFVQSAIPAVYEAGNISSGLGPAMVCPGQGGQLAVEGVAGKFDFLQI